MLKRFWFKFKKPARPSPLALGCGVTAFDLADAERFLHDKIFAIYGEQSVDEIIQNIDVSTLEEKHIRPNMGNPAARGVWFPLM